VSIILYRVDERLIHGQVVLGWGSRLRPARYLIVDDALSASDWEQELYLLALPDGVEARFVDVAEGRRLLRLWQAEGEPPAFLLTRDVATMRELARGGGLADREVVLGGIHHAPGRSRVRPYLYLDDRDRRLLAELVEEGALVTARDLPGAPSAGVQELLGEGEAGE